MSVIFSGWVGWGSGFGSQAGSSWIVLFHLDSISRPRCRQVTLVSRDLDRQDALRRIFSACLWPNAVRVRRSKETDTGGHVVGADAGRPPAKPRHMIEPGSPAPGWPRLGFAIEPHQMTLMLGRTVRAVLDSNPWRCTCALCIQWDLIFPRFESLDCISHYVH